MLKIYGIKNCDTMKKAFNYLDKEKISYEFHDYKKVSIDKATIENWLQHFPIDTLINTKGLTWKKLSEEEKALISNKQKAIALMIAQPSMIKRPIVEFKPNEFLLGFNVDEWKKIV